MDETHVDGAFRRRAKGFSSANSHHSCAISNVKGSGKHLTAVLIASAPGQLAPLFAGAGKRNVMQSWMAPLLKKEYTKDNVPHWLKDESWIPRDCVSRCTQKGSVEMDTIPHIIEHIDTVVRKAVPRERAYILFLDCHGSRKGIEGFEKARTHNIEVVVLPANTTHFLHPCDNQINKSFQKAVRDTRDDLLSLASTNVHAIGFKLKLAVSGHTAVTASIVRESFVKTGIWPVHYRFLDRLQTATFEREHSRAALINRINKAGPTSALKSVRKRLSDSDTWCKLEKIFTDFRNIGIH